MDLSHAVIKWLDHNKVAVVGVVASLLLSVSLVGCPITTGSILHRGEKVTAAELELEIADLDQMAATEKAALEAKFAALYRKADVATDDIVAKTDFRISVFDTTSGIALAAAQGASPTPQALLGTLSQLVLGGLTIGMGVDRLRASKRIRELKKQNGEAKA